MTLFVLPGGDEGMFMSAVKLARWTWYTVTGGYILFLNLVASEDIPATG